ncbi:polymer-forming cytoskeletal protein [Erwinia aphidicola]|nr:polymer-forming cytoskeletal protein [Erwinia aphidicola]
MKKNWPLWGDLDLLGMCDRRLCAVSEKNHVPPGYRRRTLYFIFIYLIFAQKKGWLLTCLISPKKDRDAGVGKNAPALNTEPAKAATSERHDDLMIKETTISLGSVLRGEITNENNITVNGTVEGNITSQKITQIGKEGSVVGTVKSAKLVINGLLKGSCHAGSVTIMSRGRVEGGRSTRTSWLLKKGGAFIGMSHQVEDEMALANKREKRPTEASHKAPAALAAVEDNPLSSQALTLTK